MEVQSISARVIALETLPIGLTPARHMEVAPMPEVSAHAPAQLAAPAAVVPPASDIAAALASEIAEADMPRLRAILEPHRSSEVAAHITALSQEATLALAQGDRARALTNLNEIAAADPHMFSVIAAEKTLQPIRPELDHLSNRLTTVAKMNAEGWLAQAEEVVETPGHASVPNWQTRPETLLHVAHRLFESGGYTNFVRSADLAQTIVNHVPLAYSPFVDPYAQAFAPTFAPSLKRLKEEELLRKGPLLASVQKTWTALRTTATPRLQTLWRRAPLLVLLLGWLTAGLVAGPATIVLRTLWPETWPASLVDFSFEVWGMGFLALVCFGFWARIRDVRS